MLKASDSAFAIVCKALIHSEFCPSTSVEAYFLPHVLQSAEASLHLLFWAWLLSSARL